MSKVKVTLVNASDRDASVGSGPTLLSVAAGAIVEAEVENTSAEAYGLLVQGVALIPEGVELQQLAAVPDEAEVLDDEHDEHDEHDDVEHDAETTTPPDISAAPEAGGEK